MIQPRRESWEFSIISFWPDYIIFVHSFNMISISADMFKTKQIFLDLLEYIVSIIWNLVPFDSVMFVLLEPSTKFVVSDMVLTLAFINVNSRKYLLSRRIVCVVAQSMRHTSSSFILRLNNT